MKQPGGKAVAFVLHRMSGFVQFIQMMFVVMEHIGQKRDLFGALFRKMLMTLPAAMFVGVMAIFSVSVSLIKML